MSTPAGTRCIMVIELRELLITTTFAMAMPHEAICNAGRKTPRFLAVKYAVSHVFTPVPCKEAAVLLLLFLLYHGGT